MTAADWFRSNNAVTDWSWWLHERNSTPPDLCDSILWYIAGLYTLYQLDFEILFYTPFIVCEFLYIYISGRTIHLPALWMRIAQWQMLTPQTVEVSICGRYYKLWIMRWHWQNFNSRKKHDRFGGKLSKQLVCINQSSAHSIHVSFGDDLNPYNHIKTIISSFLGVFNEAESKKHF